MIKVKIFGKDGVSVINNLEEWFKFAPPKQGAFHWKDYRSAKEHARYMTSNIPYLPIAIEKLLSEYTNGKECSCFGECVTTFSSLGLGNGEGRNHDSLLVFNDLVVGIEAKAEEKLDVLCGELKLEDENKRARYDGVSNLIYGDSIVNHPKIRYQMLSATIGTLIEAKKRNVDKALLLIITYNSSKLTPVNVERNEKDVDAFIDSIMVGNELQTGYGKQNGIKLFIKKLKIDLD